MFPDQASELLLSGRFPHAGGDVSMGRRIPDELIEFSPRRWGCFPRQGDSAREPRVFPTQVGMFRKAG